VDKWEEMVAAAEEDLLVAEAVEGVVVAGEIVVVDLEPKRMEALRHFPGTKLHSINQDNTIVC